MTNELMAWVIIIVFGLIIVVVLGLMYLEEPKKDYLYNTVGNPLSSIITNKLRFKAIRPKLITDLEYLRRFENPDIIEFGSGEKVYSKIIECFGYNVMTTDITDKYNPTLIVDIAKDLNQFTPQCKDFIICHHVLEHIPLRKIDNILSHFSRILRPKGVLSLAIPHRRYWFKLAIRIPALIDRTFNLFINKKHSPNSVHKWEIQSQETLEDIRDKLDRWFRSVKLIHDNLEAYFIAVK